MGHRRRPEDLDDPILFYDEENVEKYVRNNRMNQIQREMTERALELMEFDDDQSRLILDLGCGSGISGDILTAYNHLWIGCDISQTMLEAGKDSGDVDKDCLRVDLAQGLCFRQGVFDAIVSISAIQWLLKSTAYNNDEPRTNFLKLFFTAYNCLKPGAPAVFQFYPEKASDCELISETAMKAGFSGGIVIDNPNSKKARKFYLVVNAGVNYKRMREKRKSAQSSVKGAKTVKRRDGGMIKKAKNKFN